MLNWRRFFVKLFTGKKPKGKKLSNEEIIAFYRPSQEMIDFAAACWTQFHKS